MVKRTLFMGCVVLIAVGAIDGVAQQPDGPVSSVSLGTAVEAAPSRVEQAESYRDLGDRYVSEERLAEAADAYEQALSLARESFTPDERVRMAIYISWEDRLDEAREELQLVLREEPDHAGARSHLARVYSWEGALTESISEADRVLSSDPDNTDALLVKADALEWQGRFGQAIPVYREILESQNHFDARLGLSYALLSGGNRSGAWENARLLSPANDRQRSQASALRDTLDALSSPKVSIRYNLYDDSDDNESERYALAYGFGLGNQDFELQLTRIDSHGPNEVRQSRAASFSFASNLTEGLAIATAVGVTRPGTPSRPNLLTGRFSIDSRVSNGRIGLSATSDVLLDTTELVENQIRVMNYGFQASKPFAERLSLSWGYNYKNFSDGNHAHDIQFTPEFLVSSSPRVAIGYQFRYQDYARQSQGGYFDPHDYIANRIFSSLYIEQSRFYAYLNAFGGQQEYSRNGFFTDDLVVGGSLSLGITPTHFISVEINAEGGNFAAGSVSGFRYLNLGTSVSLIF